MTQQMDPGLTLVYLLVVFLLLVLYFIDHNKD